MTDPDRHLLTIFGEALDVASPEERAAYLDRTCRGDAALRQRVEALVRAHGKAGRFLEGQPPGDPTASAAGRHGGEGPGTVIGPYKLMEELGEGGMGLVFVAEQARPVHRRVALKVVKPGMDSRQVIARFEAERQALALMDHPNIAKVFDGGATPSGRPYFVMELVKGAPVTTFCDANQLSVPERLGLFLDVCSAVQHAHQKGVIHRDIKPSNVLVTSHDGTPVAKVIDFGVAKAVGRRLTEMTVYTQLAQLVGTPLYMSPEQAGQSGLDVDTRTDIYALGVLLYELLTGVTPFDGERLRTAGVDEFRRIVREEEPAKPSTRLSTLGRAAETVSTNRRADPKELRRLVRGELDWIVMKALEKDRTRRYDTASALAADVRRYLADEPVLAGPPGRGYRARKFVRRNRAALAAASGVVAALLAGVAVATWQAVVAVEARAAALAAATEQQAAKEAAQAREAETRAILDFVQNRILAAARPKGQEGGLGRDVTLREAIDEGVRFVDASFAGQPLVEARLRTTLGTSYLYLGDARTATEQFEKARTIYAKHLGEDDLDTLRSVNTLAVGYSALSRHDEALNLQQGALPALTDKLGPGHPEVLHALSNLAVSHLDCGRPAEAARLHEEALELRRTALGPDHADTHRSMHNLAICYAALNKHDEALKLREETLPLLKVSLGVGHPETLMAMNNLANSYDNAGRHKEAFELHEATLALRKEKLGPAHPDTLQSLNNLTVTCVYLGRHDRAVEMREQLVTLMTDTLGLDHAETYRSMSNLAWSYCAVDRYQDALDLFEKALAFRRRKLPPDHRDTFLTMWGVATSLVNLDRGAEAVPIIDECVTRAAGKAVDRRLIPGVMDLRLRHFKKANDADGCRATAEMWERLNRPDAESLVRAARYRAVTATAIARNPAAADEEAGRAMSWLQKAVDGGYRNVEQLKTNPDLAVLRDRDDFKKLLARVEDGRK